MYNIRSMKTDVIIVLAHSIENGNLSDIGKDRVEKAIELYKSNLASKILMTGGFGKHFNTTKVPTAEWMKRYAIKLNVLKNKILKEDKSRNTIENLLYSKNIVKKHNWKYIIIVTSDFHILRTKYIFRKLFGRKYKAIFVPVKTFIGVKRYFIYILKEIINLFRAYIQFRKN